MRAPESADLPARWRSSPPDCLRHRTPAVAGPPPSEPGRLPGQPPRCVVLQSGESLPASSRTSRSLTGRRVHLEPGQLTPVDGSARSLSPGGSSTSRSTRSFRARVLGCTAPERDRQPIAHSPSLPEGATGEASINRVKGNIAILPKGYCYIHLSVALLILAVHDAFPQLCGVIRQIGRGLQQFNRFKRVALVVYRSCVPSWRYTTNQPLFRQPQKRVAWTALFPTRRLFWKNFHSGCLPS